MLLSVKCMVCPFSFSFPWLVDLHLMARSMIIVTAVSAPFTSLQLHLMARSMIIGTAVSPPFTSLQLPLPLTQTPSSDPLHFRSIQQHLCLFAAYALLVSCLFSINSLKNYSKATAETCSAIIHRKSASRDDMTPRYPLRYCKGVVL